MPSRLDVGYDVSLSTGTRFGLYSNPRACTRHNKEGNQRVLGNKALER